MATKSSSRKSNNKSTNAPKSSSIKTEHNKTALIIIGGIFIFLLAIFALKNYVLAATVNGQPITRFDVIKELEKQEGKQTLDNLIIKTLVIQDAEKNNITVSQDEINAELKKIEDSLKAQQTTMDVWLASQGMSREDLNQAIKLQLSVQKLVENKVKITDEEVQKFVTDNDSLFPADTTPEEKLSQAREQLKQQKLSTETQNLIQDLQKNAKTIYFVSY